MSRKLILILTALFTGVVLVVSLLRSPALMLAVPVLLLGFHYFPQLDLLERRLYIAFIAVFILLSGARIAATIKANIETPPEWDFTGFWMTGRLAVERANVYDPASYHRLAASMSPLSESFTQEIVDVGFWYPPPSIFIFLPLGWVDNLQTAAILWNLFECALLVFNIYLLWQIFWPKSGWLGLAVMSALTLGLHPILLTFVYMQTTLPLLTCALLFWRSRERPIGGFWLALSILVKPFMAFAVLYLLLRRWWKPLMAMVATLVAVSLASLILLTPDVAFSYLTDNPSSRLPAYIYTESSNQSILSELLRHNVAATAQPFLNLPFLACAAALTLLTLWLIWSKREAVEEWALLLTVILGILVYPFNQVFYSVLLLLVAALGWRERETLGVHKVALAAGLLYFLAAYQSGERILFANLFAWAVIAAVIFAYRFQPAQKMPLAASPPLRERLE